ncbi:hypothetical protein ACFV29_10775 [Streptomyces sp. NPDC059690]|uniref:hypothetical protein n=1 Tax=Streptomyces sp. NPDC059690 TaxID=3346907 RepID=UPI0036ABDACA
MNASRRIRTGGALGHLLLVVMLALSVFVMHTVGHPADSASSGMSTSSHSPAVAMGDDPPAHAADSAATLAVDPGQPTSAHVPLMAMDMLSLCLAVMLGAWILAALLRSALARHPDWLARLLAQAPVLLRANPPPRGPDLAQLSILRL